MTSEPATVTVDAPPGEFALVATHLSKRFGSRVAFDDVSFEVGYGEVFGFLGPNGAGKTTTVRTLGTLIAPTSGSAIVAGIPVTAENGEAIRARFGRSICSTAQATYAGRCPRAFGSAWRSPARCSTTPRCCFTMSPRPDSIQSRHARSTSSSPHCASAG